MIFLCYSKMRLVRGSCCEPFEPDSWRLLVTVQRFVETAYFNFKSRYHVKNIPWGKWQCSNCKESIHYDEECDVLEPQQRKLLLLLLMLENELEPKVCRRSKFKRKSRGEEKKEAYDAKIRDKFILPTKMNPFDEDELTALKLSSMNISTRNAEMPSKRKRMDADHYQETHPMEYAKDAYYWLEDELDSLWVGVRIYGQSAWETMLNDSRLKFSSFRTPTSLAHRWIIERKKIESENIQDPWTSNHEKRMMDQAKSEAEITFMMIQKKAASSGSRRPSTSKKRVALNGYAKSRKLAPIKTSQDQDNITGMGNSIDPCKIDIELSLSEWVKGSDLSSEEIMSG